MNKNTFTYNKFYCFFQLKNWIVFCFILLIGIKPISDIASIFAKTKFEITNNISLENHQEKEKEPTSEDDSEKIFNMIFFKTVENLDQLLMHFDMQENIINIDFDIHLPPPRNNNYF